MSLAERLQTDMKEALRGRDTVRLETIRSVRGAVRNREIEEGRSLDDAGIVRVIRGLAKQRSEAAEQYRAGGREELAQREEAERAILESYLPAGPSEAEMEAAVRAVIDEVGATGPKDLGKVMKPALERLGPAADGRQVNAVARRLLSG